MSNNTRKGGDAKNRKERRKQAIKTVCGSTKGFLTNTQMVLSEAADLLSREQEVWLFEALRDYKAEVEAIEAIEDRTLNQNSQLWAAKQRVKRAKDAIVKANLPLVVRVAQRMECPGVMVEQFVSEGLLKLLQCIDAFKVDKGFKFSTYLYRPLYRHFNRFMQKEAKRNAGRVDGDGVFRSRAAPEETGEIDHLTEVLTNNVAGLDALEHTVVVHTYGIGVHSPKTLKTLSAHLGFSQVRIKRELARAIEKLRNVLIEEKS